MSPWRWADTSPRCTMEVCTWETGISGSQQTRRCDSPLVVSSIMCLELVGRRPGAAGFVSTVHILGGTYWEAHTGVHGAFLCPQPLSRVMRVFSLLSLNVPLFVLPLM